MIFALLISASVFAKCSAGETKNGTNLTTSCTEGGSCSSSAMGSSIVNSTSTAVSNRSSDLFCSQCYGNSVCRTNPDGRSVCVCPPDYDGSFCTTTSSIGPNTCSENSCKNGGTCVVLFNKTICSCSLIYAGLDCSRAALLFRTSVNISVDNSATLSIEKNETLAKTSKVLSNDSICSFVHECLKGGNMSEVAALWLSCQVINTSKRTVDNAGERSSENLINALLLLKFDSGRKPLPINAKFLEQQLRLGSNKATNLPEFAKNKLVGFKTEEVNYCTENYHDCSQFAVCRATVPGYSCACKGMYTDISANAGYHSGRICTFSALGGWLVGLLVMLPFVIGAVLIVRHLRRKQRRRFWLSRTFMYDDTQLIENNSAMYRNDI